MGPLLQQLPLQQLMATYSKFPDSPRPAPYGPRGAGYLGERDEQRAAAFLSAGEAQIAVGGVEAAGRVAASVRRPHRARRHLVELLGAREPEQGQGVLPDGLLLQNPAVGGAGGGKSGKKNIYI